MTALRAYHNQQAVKEWYLTRLRQHYRAGEIVECGLNGLSHSSSAKPLSAECVVDPISMLGVFARRVAAGAIVSESHRGERCSRAAPGQDVVRAIAG